MTTPLWMQLHSRDNLVVLTTNAPKGSTIFSDSKALETAVNSGHKIALADIASGGPIYKFGHIIGYASQDISRGDHIHTHNCAIGAYDTDQPIGVDLELAQASVPTVKNRTFMGFDRGNGKAGTRNFIALISTVNCSATVIKRAAHQLNNSGVLDQYPNIDGVIAIAHGTGCGMAATGQGSDILERTLWGYATHPNTGAAIFVGLGCEVMQLARMKKIYGNSGSFHGLTIQENGGTLQTIQLIVQSVTDMLPKINAISRTPISASELTIGLQCGGSDGFSGVTANPALGIASDILIGMGATVILSETPEIYGAEELLLRRAANQEIGNDLNALIKWWEDYTRMHGGDMDNNPSPGNKAGGLTTILEKSLGAVAKAGSTPLNGVYKYAEPVKTKGLVFMDTPGYDPVSATGQIAGGSQVIVFTTGRGSAFGSTPAPTLKLSSNSKLYEAMPDDMDLNCGDILEGTTLQEKGEQIVDLILTNASGKKSKSEILGLGENEFLPWQIGAVM